MKRFKVSFFGESGVGKSSIVARFMTGHFNEFHNSTVGAAFSSKLLNIDGRCIELNIWDTTGQERYRSLSPLYYRDSKVIILVYDLTKHHSYIKCHMWLKEIIENYRHYSKENFPLIYLAGNKIDLVNDNMELRKVDPNVLQDFTSKNNLIPFEVSAKSGHGIIELFNDIASRLIESNQINPIDEKAAYIILGRKIGVNEGLKNSTNKQCCFQL